MLKYPLINYVVLCLALDDPPGYQKDLFEKEDGKYLKRQVVLKDEKIHLLLICSVW